MSINVPHTFQSKRFTVFASTLFVLLWLIGLSSPSSAAEISTVNVKLQNYDIYVGTSIKSDLKMAEDLNEGISKELEIRFDLFRVWKLWPNEFVTGRAITRKLKSDPIKREYHIVSIDGTVELKKRFKDVESMLEWALSITDLKLTNIKELEPGTYFVRVTLTSHIRKVPKVITILIPIPLNKEFSISKDSIPFQITQKEIRSGIQKTP